MMVIDGNHCPRPDCLLHSQVGEERDVVDNQSHHEDQRECDLIDRIAFVIRS